MDRRFTILLLSLSAVLTLEPDYYWKNYDAVVPQDAFEAGIDSAGNSIYIGQALFVDVGLLPGTLHAGSTNITSAAQNRYYTTDQNVKILCTKNSQRLRWVPVKSYSDIASLKGAQLVVGGREPYSLLHLARGFHNGNTGIGKIYNLQPDFLLALFPNYEAKGDLYPSFDLLVWQ